MIKYLLILISCTLFFNNLHTLFMFTKEYQEAHYTYRNAAEENKLQAYNKLLDLVDHTYPTDPARVYNELTPQRLERFKANCQQNHDSYYAHHCYHGEFSPLEHSFLLNKKMRILVEDIGWSPETIRATLQRAQETEKTKYLHALFSSALGNYDYSLLSHLMQEYNVTCNFLAPLVVQSQEYLEQFDPLGIEILKASPLHQTIVHRNEKSTQFLLDHGADPLLKDSKDRTALDMIEDDIQNFEKSLPPEIKDYHDNINHPYARVEMTVQKRLAAIKDMLTAKIEETKNSQYCSDWELL